MNLTVFATGGSAFVNCECIKGYTFKMVAFREKSAYLAIASMQMRGISEPATAVPAKRQDNHALMAVSSLKVQTDCSFMMAAQNREQGKSDRMAANYALLQDKSAHLTVHNASRRLKAS